jgi:hypothetical protein
MKQAVVIVILIVSLVTAQGQTLGQKEAKQFLGRGWSYIVKNDSVSFAQLWSLNDSLSQKHRRPHSVGEIYADYRAVREWLVKALNQNMKIAYVEVEPMNLAGTDTKYWITVWFKYSGRYAKGFGFYVAYFGGKWVVRDNTSTSESGR